MRVTRCARWCCHCQAYYIHTSCHCVLCGYIYIYTHVFIVIHVHTYIQQRITCGPCVLCCCYCGSDVSLQSMHPRHREKKRLDPKAEEHSRAICCGQRSSRWSLLALQTCAYICVWENTHRDTLNSVLFFSYYLLFIKTTFMNSLFKVKPFVSMKFLSLTQA